MYFYSLFQRHFLTLRKTAIVVFIGALPLYAESDAASKPVPLTPLQAALIKENDQGRYSPFPSYRQREEDLFTSKKYYAMARRPGKKNDTLHLFDADGKKKCAIAIDECFSDASLSDVSWFLINRIVNKKECLRECAVYDQTCNIMSRIQFSGASMLISPSGDFGAVSGPDPSTGIGDFRIFCFRQNDLVSASPIKDASFLGARFCMDNSVVTLWKVKRDTGYGVTVAKYDAASGATLASIDLVNEKGRPLACPPPELVHFEDSPTHDLFGFFAIDDRYVLTAQQGVPNTTVVFDLDMRVKLFSSDRMHRTIKVVDDNLVAVGTWFDASMFSLQTDNASASDEKIELFDFSHEKAIGETDGIAYPLIGALRFRGDIYFTFDVNTLFLSFDGSQQKFSRLWQENAGGSPVATCGKKIFFYSFSTKKFLGL